MFSKITARASGIAVSGLFVLTMGLGIITSGGVVHAQDNNTGGFGPPGTCTYRNIIYPEGSTVIMDDGFIYTCHSDGTWSMFHVSSAGGTKFNKLPTAGLKAAQ